MTRLRLPGVLLMIAGALAIGFLLAGRPLLALLVGDDTAAAVLEFIRAKTIWALYPPVRLVREVVLTIPFWCAIAITFGLPWLIPARPASRTSANSLAQDVVWFFYESILHNLIVGIYVRLLVRAYEAYLPQLTIAALTEAPGWLRFILAFLLLELLFFAQHYLHHNVPFLWRFHALHHSQRELNFFTDYRYHVLEYVVRHTFLVVPFLVVKIDPPVVAAFTVVYYYYSRFLHGNIRTNLGPLKYVLVTPQSHRVHHSIEAPHHNTNYGGMLSVFDHLLGTQCRDYDVYPGTGIRDETFPLERSRNLRDLLVTPLRQMLHPFPRLRPRADARREAAQP